VIKRENAALWADNERLQRELLDLKQCQSGPIAGAGSGKKNESGGSRAKLERRVDKLTG
jgi:hypothetical protein